MYRKLKGHLTNLQVLEIDVVLVAVLVLSLLAVGFVSSQPPAQDAAVVVPSPTTSTPSATPSLSPSPEQSVAVYNEYPALSDRVGTVTLESLDLSWPIFEGTGDDQLSLGVGHYVGSVLPGLEDNSILAGHRSTVFGRLGELKKGDRILVETDAGIFVYVARKFKVVSRSDQNVIQPSDTPILTLSTCYPFGNVGHTTQAYIVTADLVESIFKEQGTE